MNERLYDLANIRTLLLNAFDDRELRRLCYDVRGFRPVYDQLAAGTGKASIVDTLLEYADRTLQLDALLALVQERNPARFELHGPYYIDDLAAAPPRPSAAANPGAAPAAPTQGTGTCAGTVFFGMIALGFLMLGVMALGDADKLPLPMVVFLVVLSLTPTVLLAGLAADRLRKRRRKG